MTERFGLLAGARSRFARIPLLLLTMIIVAAVLIAAAMIITLHQSSTASSRFDIAPSEELALPPDSALDRELARCRSLSPGTDDEQCRTAWDKSRRRFFEGK